MNIRYPIKCVLLEDEPAWQRKLQQQLATFSEISLLGLTDNIDEAFTLICEQRPQAVFMDVKLVGGTAFQLLERLERAHVRVPWLVIITGFPEYAVDALNHHKEKVVKFLPKPMLENWQEKLSETIHLLASAIHLEADKGCFLIKMDSVIERIPYHEVVWVEVAPGGRIYIVTDEREYQTNLTLRQFLQDYPKSPLRQVSRGYAVNRDRIRRIMTADRGVEVTYRGENKFIGIGETFYQDLLIDLQII